MIAINAHFDSGNVEVVSVEDPGDLRLRIRKDAGDEHLQWFHFRVSGCANEPLRIVLENASEASYPSAWTGYRACCSHDGKNWFRAQTRYEGGALVITHKSPHASVYFAYFAPYPAQRHVETVGALQRNADVELEVLGRTLDGRDLDLLILGSGEVPVWIIARQHPGESMAEWLVEGLLERLVDPACALARKLRKAARFYVVPNMNPDGSARGHLRTNASGANLNREWHEPTMARSPEVKLVRDRMDRSGLRFCLDVHGDEELPFNFIAGSDGVEDLPAAIVEARHTYEAALVRACPDFQTEHGYPKAAPGKANMTMATNQLAHRFQALCMTLEQPFKDNDDAPMPHEGWSPRRAKLLGHAQLDALAHVLPAL